MKSIEFSIFPKVQPAVPVIIISKNRPIVQSLLAKIIILVKEEFSPLLA